MTSGRAKVLVCLVAFGLFAVVAAAWVDEPQFDLVSGRDWAERVAVTERAATDGRLHLPLAGLHAEPPAAPTIGNGWILLAGGLIVSVLALAVQAALVGTTAPRLRTAPAA